MNNFQKLEIDEIYNILESSKNGLSDKKANQKLEEFGKNVLPKGDKETIFDIFFSQLKSPIIYIMILSAILSYVAKEYVDVLAIIFIIIVDAIVGTIQENSASKEAESLQKLIEVKTKVIRDGKEKVVSAEDIAVGDIIVLESGDKVPADARIISALNLSVDESILTGESIPREKNNGISIRNTFQDMNNMLFGGTSVVKGRGTAIVVATGAQTEIGKISKRVAETKEEKSPLTIRMEKLTKFLTKLILVVAVLLTILMIIKQEPIEEVFTSVVALSVSALPEGLPLSLTLALTIGSSRMSKKSVIVKKLNAVESLGSCTIIASDKTGTLTVNEQTAKKIVLPDDSIFSVEGSGYNADGRVIAESNDSIWKAMQVSKLGIINNEATLKYENNKWNSFGDSIDIAFLALGEKLNLNSFYTEIKEVPYESEKKYSAVFYSENGDNFCTVKGSLEKVLSFCDSSMVDDIKMDLDVEKINKQNRELASQGFRVIALAKSDPLKSVPKKDVILDEDIPKLSFCGLVAFIDPIRKETIESIKNCKKAGIKVVMITGDHPLTAYAIARELELASNYDEVTNGEELDKYLAKGNKDFDKFIKNKRVFTRVTPIQKLEIINSYKRLGEFVAVTGDGVNDSPAIKAASIGIAMGSGTDVAKDASKMIIQDDNFYSIVNAVEEGRIAYSNIRKVVYFLVSCGLSEVLFFTLSILCNLEPPLVAIQLLWLNIVTDGLQDISLSFEREDKSIMNEKPRSPKESIFNKEMIEEVLLSGTTIGLIVFFNWFYLRTRTNVSLEQARGYIMMLMVFLQNFHVLNCRSEKKSFIKTLKNKNLLLPFSISLAIISQIIISNLPNLSKFLKIGTISFEHGFTIFLLSLPILAIMEVYKYIRYGGLNGQNNK